MCPASVKKALVQRAVVFMVGSVVVGVGTIADAV
jgi:hypothetical protein